MIHFTSDTHFFHENIIAFCNRPFKCAEHMNEELVDNWNKQVGPKDEVYHLGDVSFGRNDLTKQILDRLNGRIYLIQGNHDHGLAKQMAYRFEWVKDYYELKWQKYKFVLCHFPFAVWNESHRGSFHLHGHSHGTLKNLGRRMDVGVDPMGYSPIRIETVTKLLLKEEPWFEDYHRNREGH